MICTLYISSKVTNFVPVGAVERLLTVSKGSGIFHVFVSVTMLAAVMRVRVPVDDVTACSISG